ncbi:hypothetical protein K7N18_20415 [Burkholderia arboris]|uniref:hypothetical protein n=1 Tax=Burkholderia arboris TaxID=488730 RepID=UPI001CA39015|nr:hypothetical protein [Burkholderia arboris]MBY8607193.1 hypothetical protein [Burkholderia arboris]
MNEADNGGCKGWAKITKIIKGDPVGPVVGQPPDVQLKWGYVFVSELEPITQSGPVDQVVVLKTPYPVNAGDIVAHIGQYQRYREAKPTPPLPTRPLLHLRTSGQSRAVSILCREVRKAYQGNQMISKFIFGASLALVLTSTAMAGSYQIPGLDVCDANSSAKHCALQLDGNGYLVDSASGTRLSSDPDFNGVVNDATLYESKISLVLEYSDSSSSKNWTVLIFSYKNGTLHATNYISLSKMTLVNGERWGGQSCRGDVVLTRGKTILSSAFKALCNGDASNNSPTPPNTEAIKIASQTGLVITVPTYDADTKFWSVATYAFPSNSMPDASALLCLSGCKTDPAHQRLGGWIGKDFWIEASLSESKAGTVDGSYIYLKKKTPISIKGSVANGSINLTEYSSSGNVPVATLIGNKFDSSYVGTWTSNNKKYKFLLGTILY